MRFTTVLGLDVTTSYSTITFNLKVLTLLLAKQCHLHHRWLGMVSLYLWKWWFGWGMVYYYPYPRLIPFINPIDPICFSSFPMAPWDSAPRRIPPSPPPPAVPFWTPWRARSWEALSWSSLSPPEQQGQRFPEMGVALNWGTPIAGWFIVENPNLKWMMNRGSPISRNFSICVHLGHKTIDYIIYRHFLKWGTPKSCKPSGVAPFMETPHIVTWVSFRLLYCDIGMGL